MMIADNQETTPLFDYGARLERFVERLAAQALSAAFLPESADLEYLTGVPRIRNFSDRDIPAEELTGCFIGADGQVLFLIRRGQWMLEAGPLLRGTEHLEFSWDDDVVATLREAGRRVGAGEAIALGDGLVFRQAELLKQAFPASELRPLADLMSELRLQKEEAELDAIARAGAVSVAALEATLSHFSPPFSRLDFLSELKHQLGLHGSEGISYEPDLFAAGEGASFGWCADCRGNANAPIAAPTCISVDWGAIVDGYRSDVGRTLFVGEPPSEQLRALKAVRDAQAAGIAALTPGSEAGAIDDVAREVMESAGFGDAFRSTAGHGIGLEVHEHPRLRHGAPLRLPERAVLTVEIGAWRDGELAAFWEDEVAVRSGGGEILTPLRAEPYVLSA